jgi:hypothetical protein
VGASIQAGDAALRGKGYGEIFEEAM